MQFGSMFGSWAFISLGVLIIIYLIRPKPKDMTIPSLMFIIKETGRSIKSSFLEKLLRNLVLLLQLLALAAISFALMQPVINMTYDSSAASTVIILDASASMGAKNNARFDKALSIAKDSMKGDVSIVLAEEFPVTILTKGSATKANSLLSGLKPKGTGSNIGDAMMLAKDFLDGKEGRVVVLSDFAYTTGPDPTVVKKILEAEGATVDFVNVAEKGNNVGIIDLVMTRYQTEVVIKNFNDRDVEITASVINDGKEIKKVKLPINKASIGTFSFETPSGQTEIKINEKDDLDIDNHAYMSAPEMSTINVLMVTNKENTYLKKALESAKDVKVTVAEPPILPKFDGYDVIILNDFDKTKILTGTFEDLKALVEKGKSVIVTSRPDLGEVNYKGLIPVIVKEKIDKVSSKVYPYQESRDDKYGFAEEESLDFGTVNQLYNVEAENGSVIYAMTADSIPIIVSSKRGEGSIVYYGIMDSYGTFKSSTSYPIFWNDLINSLVGTEDIRAYNYLTGKILVIGNPTDVKTPSGRLKTGKILLDEVGFYEFNDKTIATDLLNEQESDINREVKFETTASKSYKAEKVEKKKYVSLEIYLAILALLFILAEMAIVKYRGDL